MAAVRVAALVLVVALTGPSVGALVCDWACASRHEQSSSSGCHEHSGSGLEAALASVHRCHELAATAESILTNVPQLETRTVVAVVTLFSESRIPAVLLHTVRSSARSHAPPPPLIPLRV